MKNTRIARLKQSKRVKQATKLLTVGLLVCPLAIGTIKALADEAETTPPVEQVEETTATTEEVAPVEETETIEPVQPEVVEEIQTEEATPIESVEQPSEMQDNTLALENIGKEESETFAVKASYSENFYTSSGSPMWSEDSCTYTYTFSNGAAITFYFISPDFNNFTWLISDYVNNEYISTEGTATSGQAISFDFNGNHYEISLTVDVIPTKQNCTITFDTRGNGSLSSYPTIHREEGSRVDLSEMPIPTASAGSHFKGWEVNGMLNGGGWTNGTFSGFYVDRDTVVTAVFESGDLDWDSYNQMLGRYEELLSVKEAYAHFGYTDIWEGLNELYENYVQYRDANLYSLTLSQEELDRMTYTMNGMNLNLVDHYNYFDMNITSQIKDYHDSVKSIYDDSTAYTPESKQAFNDAWLVLNEKAQGSWGQEKELFDAYQALKTAEQYLVKAETPAPDKTKLEQAVKDAEAKLAEGGWKDTTELETALTTAKEVLANAASTQTVIDSALSSLNTATSALEKEDIKASITTKLESSIKDAESKLTAGGYTAQSINTLKQALQNAKDVLANANSTQVEIDEAQKALDLAITNLVKEDNSNGGNTGNNGSNGTGNSTTNPNTSNNGTSNTNNQTNSNNQNSTTTTTKPAGNNTNKDSLPQTGEQSTTNAVIAGLSLTMLSILAWFKRKKV